MWTTGLDQRPQEQPLTPGGVEWPLFLDAVERRMKGLLIGEGASLGGKATTLVLARGAKRARPRLIHALGIATGAPVAGLVDLAAAAELIHAGSLLHDDVIDGGTERRGDPTLNATDGNLVAVLAGDYLLARALGTVAPWGSELAVRAASTLAEMVAGVLTESEMRGRVLEVDVWRRIAEQKTGSLFAFCTVAPALLVGGAHVDETDLAVRDRAGRAFGILFQLADDALDFMEGRGKDAFADLANASPNILVAFAHARGIAAPSGPSFSPEAGYAFLQAALSAGVLDDLRATADDALRDVAALLDVSGREGVWILEEARALMMAALSIHTRSGGEVSHEGLHGSA
jgi:geranylgeranyl pyrophosphate synthase